jgi:hypothetical protein
MFSCVNEKPHPTVELRVRNLFHTKSNQISKYSNMFSLKIPRVRWKKDFGRERRSLSESGR